MNALRSEVTTSTSTCSESQLRTAYYLWLLLSIGQRLHTSYLSAINFHDQGPSTTAACAKVGHVTIHRNLPRAHLEKVSFAAFRSDYKTKHVLIKWKQWLKAVETNDKTNNANKHLMVAIPSWQEAVGCLQTWSCRVHVIKDYCE